MKLSVAVLALAAVSTSVGAQRATTPADARRLLTVLAADSMEGRATGTRGAQRAARFIAAEMRRIGLEAAGDSAYHQRVPIVVDTTGGQMRPRLVTDARILDTVPADRKPAAANIVGIIRGSDPALREEAVLVAAHYDHLGIRGPGVNGDSIYNGADDDASGVTALLEAARQLLEGPRPKRTVILAAMIGEEVGLVGTNWYIANPTVPLDRIVANLAIEMIGRPDSLAGGPGRAWLTGYERSTMGELFTARGLPIVPDRRPEQRFFERSDNIGFARRGIVAHTLSSFNLHSDYHRPSDEAAFADYDHMASVINVAAEAIRVLADGPRPEWHPGGKPEAPAGRGRGGQ